MISTADRRKTVVLINTAGQDVPAWLQPARWPASVCEPTSAGQKLGRKSVFDLRSASQEFCGILPEFVLYWI